MEGQQSQEMKIDELVFMAKIAEQTERFEDMVMQLKELIKLQNELNDEEQKLFSIAQKNAIGLRRTAWRSMIEYEMKEKNKATRELEIVKQQKGRIEKEMQNICKEVLQLLADPLLKTATSKESKIFYLKMKGDQNRYLAEFQQSEEYLIQIKWKRRKTSIENASNAYEEAMAFAKTEMKTTHPIRLGLALNYSVFFYEIKNDVQKAQDNAKKAFDESLNDLDDIEGEQYKDTTTVMQLIRDNLNAWKTELKEVIQKDNKYFQQNPGDEMKT